TQRLADSATTQPAAPDRGPRWLFAGTVYRAHGEAIERQRAVQVIEGALQDSLPIATASQAVRQEQLPVCVSARFCDVSRRGARRDLGQRGRARAMLLLRLAGAGGADGGRVGGRIGKRQGLCNGVQIEHHNSFAFIVDRYQSVVLAV